MLVPATIIVGQTRADYIPHIHKAVRDRLVQTYQSANDANGAAGLAAIEPMSNEEVYTWVAANWAAVGLQPVEINPVAQPQVQVPEVPQVPQVPEQPTVNDGADSGFNVGAAPSDDPDDVAASLAADTGTAAQEPAKTTPDPEPEPEKTTPDPEPENFHTAGGAVNYTGLTKFGRGTSLKGQVLAALRGGRTDVHTGESIAATLNEGHSGDDLVKVTTINSTLSALKSAGMVIPLGKVDGQQSFRAVESLPKIEDAAAIGHALIAATEAGSELNIVVGNGLVTFTPWSV